MRRLFFWYLPVAGALLAGVIFAAGFAAYVRGGFGEAIDDSSDRPIAAEPQRGEVAIVILGDSLARGAGDETGLGIAGRVAEELRGRKIAVRKPVNLGVNGARTRDLLRQIESRNIQTLIAQANVIVISIGGNDLWGAGGRSGPPPNPEAAMADVLERIEEIVERVRRVNPKGRIFLVGLYNPFVTAPFGPQLSVAVSRWNSKMIERFAPDPNVTLVSVADLFSHRDRLSFDRFHPSTEGYALIARRIADAL